MSRDRGKLTERFQKAFRFAARVHARQKRKGTRIPYLAHLMSVAAMVIEAGGDEATAVAALLHDAVEDQGGLPRLSEIRRRFGPRVANIVHGSTDAETLPKPPWRERKEKYLRHLAQAPPEVRLVSAADKLHNARAILADYRRLGEALWKRFHAGREEQLWYYTELISAYRQSPRDARIDPLVDELERTIAELRRLLSLPVVPAP